MAMAWGNDAVRDKVIRTILGESNGSPEGMISVAHVMKNRADSGAWGDRSNGGLTRVITAPKQFSMWNTDDPKLRALAGGVNGVSTSDPRYQRAAAIADGVFSENIPDPTNGATHYHTPSVSPDWSSGVKPVATIGGHYFYKLPLTASNTAGTAVTSPSSVGVSTATPAPATSGAPIPKSAGADTREAVNHALANAKSMLGKNEVPNEAELQAYLHDGGQDLDPHKVAWCAAFVSASLQKAGLPVPTQVVKDSAFGPGAYAPNYKTYGSAVTPESIQAGDILVANDGSHVGFAEGPVRQGINGPEVQMIAGNEADNSGKYARGSYTNPTTGAVANRSQVGMVGERWVPLSQYSARRYTPAGDTTVAAAAPPEQNQGQQTAPPAPASAPAAASAPATAPSPSAGFSGPGSDKVSLVQGMTTGTSHNPQITTAANWGNLFGGSSPGTPPAAPAAAAAPPPPQPAPAATPTPPLRAPLDQPPGSPMASIMPNWGATTPSDDTKYPAAAPAAMPGSGLNGEPAMTRGGPSMGFPAMTNPFGAPPPNQQVSQLPGSMMASAQNLLKLLFPVG